MSRFLPLTIITGLISLVLSCPVLLRREPRPGEAAPHPLPAEPCAVSGISGRMLQDEGEGGEGEGDEGEGNEVSSCGSAHCYAHIAAGLPPLLLDWAALVELTTPGVTADEFTYVEDSQARANELDGFDLNNVDPSVEEDGAAGYTYVGQLLSHDINLDETSVLGQPVDPATLPNSNTPDVDLDTLYSFKGVELPASARDGALFRIGCVAGSGLPRDFPRLADGAADVLDPRNDEHRIVSQLTVALMALHNKFVAEEMAVGNGDGGSPEEVVMFEAARRATILEWQAVVLYDLLPALLDNQVLSHVAAGTRLLYNGHLKADKALPVEFSTAAYRLFHSRARGRYRLNAATDGSDSTKKRARLFDVGNDEPVLTGGSPLTELFVIDWSRFFGAEAEVSRIMDMLYSRPMVRLPLATPGHPEEAITVQCTDLPACPIEVNVPTVLPFGAPPSEEQVKANLALLDLLRGQTHSLPGGIAFATYAGDVLGADIQVLTLNELSLKTPQNPFGLPDGYELAYDDVPLLWYLAHESIIEQSGRKLGRLGSMIVAEVLYGLVEESEISIFGPGEPFVSKITQQPPGAMNTMEALLDFIGWS